MGIRPIAVILFSGKLSWVWREELVDVVPDSVSRIDAWKASGSKEPIMSYFDNRDTASDDDCCFIDAIRAALYHLGCPDLVTVEMWEAFEKTRPSDIQYGVTREDVTEFFKYLQRQSVPLDCDELQRNLLDGSYTNAAQLDKFIRRLGSGTYSASVGEDDLGHCFVVIVEGPNDDIKILGWYDEKRNPPVAAGLLLNYLWVNRVRWLCRIILKPGYVCRGKRKSRSQKKREKHERLQLQSS
ncbi:Hypothetical protein PHPALM_13117 [Phytophthora palmivora]|uniref:Uncharacterized protein n=1 Tax=Phytophthora palmivora TaxID=4796 RepID=A0A2P4XY04_9STRA|nr:Hypothetical protein PHPALM_13117 [Phytophthora palmivora]